MPCSGGYPPDNHEIVSGFASQISQLAEKVSFYRSEADKLSDMLCRTLKVFDDNLGCEHLPTDIQAWWQEHKEWDKKRKETNE